MDDTHLITHLLERAVGDAVDGIAPPAVTELTSRRRQRRRRRWSLVAAVSATVVVAAVAAAAPHVLRRSPSTVSTSAPIGPGVTASQLARYRWTELPPAPITGRSSAVAVWTGSQVIFWGGTGDKGRLFNDGAAYEPATRTWSKLPRSPLTARDNTASTWAGGPIFIWGGRADDSSNVQLNSGALYDPGARRWSTIPPAPIATSNWAQALWTGSRVVLLTTVPGNRPGGEFSVVHADAYNPRTNKWKRLPDLTLPGNHPALGVTALAGGSRIYAWSYWSVTVPLSPSSAETTSGIDSYTLDTSTGDWTSNQLVPDQHHGIYQPVWTGREIIVPPGGIYCGFCSSPGGTNGHGYLVNPDTSAIQPMTPGPVDQGGGPQDYWTGRALLAYGTYNDSAAAAALPAAAAWDPATGTWTDLIPAPLAGGPNAVWAGSSLIQWGSMYPIDQVARTPTPSWRTAGLQFGPP